MKKSGLADSPLFRPSPAALFSAGLEPSVKSQSTLPTPVFPPPDTQLHERTDAQMHERTTTQPHEGTTAQPHKRADAQPHNHLQPSSERKTTRESFDIFEDQAEAIERLRLQWKREQGRHFTKGEVMRTLLEEILALKK